jgi:hypothetical protein
LGTVLGIELGTGCTRFSAGLNGFGSDAEEAEALVCKTSLSGFESRRYLQKKRSHNSSQYQYRRPDVGVYYAGQSVFDDI